MPSMQEMIAYRNELRSRGISPGRADAMVEERFGVDKDVFNPHKPGGLGKIVGGAGDVLKNVAPALSFIPGVGWVAAAAAGAAGGALGELNDVGRNWGEAATGALKHGAIAGGTSYLGSKAGVFGRDGGAGSLFRQMGADGATSSGFGGLVKRGAGWVKDHPELAIASIGALNNARQGARSSSMSNEAIEIARRRYADSEPLRQLLIQKLSALDAGASPLAPGTLHDPGNPYSRRS